MVRRLYRFAAAAVVLLTMPLAAQQNVPMRGGTPVAPPGFKVPPLPDALQYRFVNRDLVLLDCDASLIIDVLPRALRSPDLPVQAASPSSSED